MMLNDESEYISQSDEAQFERIKDFQNADGIGDLIFDTQDISDYGLSGNSK